MPTTRKIVVLDLAAKTEVESGSILFRVRGGSHRHSVQVQSAGPDRIRQLRGSLPSEKAEFSVGHRAGIVVQLRVFVAIAKKPAPLQFARPKKGNAAKR